MTHEYIDDECYRCIHYTKFITDYNTWTCEVCHLTESGHHDPGEPINDISWGRYQLECKHQFHIRCLRKWCKTMNYVGCACCGPLLEIETNEYCNKCETFGHPTNKCSL